MNDDLVTYYDDRASEYEKIYLKSERQEDLQEATRILQDLFNQKAVFEIACGTGYWTERIAETASSIYATDINESVLSIAKNKRYKNKVTFGLADIYKLESGKKYDNLFAGFIWSHILLQDLDLFIDKIKDLVENDGTIVIMDNNYVEGSNHAISKTDERGNTYQTRKLDSGASHLVLKNFSTREFIIDKLSRIGVEISYIKLEYFW
ncbi:MAG: methyltransferase domain-containing protein, partial [Saprospiraceae bacterium]